jgi:hypothetical protein
MPLASTPEATDSAPTPAKTAVKIKTEHFLLRAVSNPVKGAREAIASVLIRSIF